jgi:hypothetical protein
MMTKLKTDLDRELDSMTSAINFSIENNSSNNNTNNTNNIKMKHLTSKIKHLEDQMKCIVFLMMQYQIGLENCSEPQQKNSTVLFSNELINDQSKNTKNSENENDEHAEPEQHVQLS